MTVERKFPVWRSALFVPANVERFVVKAVERGADALIIDLEDSVPLAEKANARKLIPGIVKRFRDTGSSDVMVRINQPLELAGARSGSGCHRRRGRDQDHQGRRRRSICACSTRW